MIHVVAYDLKEPNDTEENYKPIIDAISHSSVLNHWTVREYGPCNRLLRNSSTISQRWLAAQWASRSAQD